MIDLWMDKSAIGDALSYTALMNATPCRMNIANCSSNAVIAPLFYGLGDVRVVEGNRSTHSEIHGGGVHNSRRMLVHFGFDRYPCVPRIKLFPEEVARAKAFVARFKEPIAIRDLSNGEARNIPFEMAQRIVDINPEKTFINFGTSKDHAWGTPDRPRLRKVIYVDDWPLRMVAACYYHIGRYVGCDTGNYHLMLAVNGKCDVIIPEHGEGGYDWPLHLYPADAFQDGIARVNYLRRKAMANSTIVGVRY